MAAVALKKSNELLIHIESCEPNLTYSSKLCK